MRTQWLAELASRRADVGFLVLASPDRLGGDPRDWWDVAKAHAGDGKGVIVQCTHASARQPSFGPEPPRPAWGADGLATGSAQLLTGERSLVAGTARLVEGRTKAASVATTLASGTTSLAKSLGTLDAMTVTLPAQTLALAGGAPHI